MAEIAHANGEGTQTVAMSPSAVVPTVAKSSFVITNAHEREALLLSTR